MPRSPARRLIIVFAIVTALQDLVIGLPGGPSFESKSTLVAWLVIDALLIWRLWHGSVFAWFLLLLDALLTLPLFLLIGPPSDAASMAALLLGVALTVLLFMPSLLKFVWSRHETAAAG